MEETIQLLELKRSMQEPLLKNQFNLTYERLKPVNLIKSSLLELVSAPRLVDNLLSTAIGLATGYLSRKIVVGGSGNIIRKLFGLFMQMGVTNSVAQHPDSIKFIGHYIYKHFLIRKERKNQ